MTNWKPSQMRKLISTLTRWCPASFVCLCCPSHCSRQNSPALWKRMFWRNVVLQHGLLALSLFSRSMEVSNWHLTSELLTRLSNANTAHFKRSAKFSFNAKAANSCPSLICPCRVVCLSGMTKARTFVPLLLHADCSVTNACPWEHLLLLALLRKSWNVSLLHFLRNLKFNLMTLLPSQMTGTLPLFSSGWLSPFHRMKTSPLTLPSVNGASKRGTSLAIGSCQRGQTAVQEDWCHPLPSSACQHQRTLFLPWDGNSLSWHVASLCSRACSVDCIDWVKRFPLGTWAATCLFRNEGSHGDWCSTGPDHDQGQLNASDCQLGAVIKWNGCPVAHHSRIVGCTESRVWWRCSTLSVQCHLAQGLQCTPITKISLTDHSILPRNKLCNGNCHWRNLDQPLSTRKVVKTALWMLWVKCQPKTKMWHWQCWRHNASKLMTFWLNVHGQCPSSMNKIVTCSILKQLLCWRFDNDWERP